ncbi:MAG TPA: outer membrane beta-barrel protein [Saprospiraceae bacterium]|nr:outer membrane beta-barrel protein [Saprospiraceae bacterium]HMQ84471.1 outer membrane beta-barrel protein [Saprospiraceae bacterium]
MLKNVILILLCLLVSNGLYSQKDRRILSPENRLYVEEGRLYATAQFGLGYSQLVGDTYPGFHQGNLQIGFGLMAVLNPKTTLEMDVVYLRKGSRTETGNANGDKNRDIDLTYIEWPVFVRYLLGDPTMGPFIEGGLVYGRLTKVVISEPGRPMDAYLFSAFQPYFNKNEISGLTGLGFAFSPTLGVRLRYQRGLSALFRGSKHEIEHPTEGSSNENIAVLNNELLALHLYLRL